MDNPPYHSRLVHKTPSTKMRKAEIVEALERYNIPIPNEVTRENSTTPKRPTKNDLLQLFKVSVVLIY